MFCHLIRFHFFGSNNSLNDFVVLQYRSKVSHHLSYLAKRDSRLDRKRLSSRKTRLSSRETRLSSHENHWSIYFGINHKQFACEKMINFSRLGEVCTIRASGFSGSCFTRHFKTNKDLSAKRLIEKMKNKHQRHLWKLLFGGRLIFSLQHIDFVFNMIHSYHR